MRKFLKNVSLSCLLAMGLSACAPAVSTESTEEQLLPEQIFTGVEGKADGVRPTWAPLPYEDRVKGRNDNAYEPYIGEKDAVGFIASAKEAALQICREHKIPASAVVGMAAVESGYGSTRLAYNANNYFSTKVWGKNPPNSWQLQGQPDESSGSPDPTKIKENLGGANRLIFDEATRADNRYRAFKTPLDSFRYLAEVFLKRPDKPGKTTGNYLPSAKKWLASVTANPNGLAEASKQYISDVADAGYCHLGGSAYRQKIGPVMDKYNLYELDKQCLAAEPLPTELLTIWDIEVWPTVDSDNETVKGLANIQVRATDKGSGMNRVEFYFHNEDEEGDIKTKDVLITTLTKPTDPIDSNYMITWDTTKAGPDGTYSIIVQAYDNAIDPETGKSAPTHRFKVRSVELKNGANAAKAPSTNSAVNSGSSSGSGSSSSGPVNGTFGSCKASGRSGTCLDKAYCQGGTPVSGLCPGPASVICCVWK